MPLNAPNLDDRTYAQIKQEALARIPRYLPEWTDFNESDPGITLIELFSWLTELMLYRMNRLPDLNYIKFLKLLNLELRPPVPADAHLSFTATAGAKAGPVAAGSQVAAQVPDTGELVVFETNEGLDLIPFPLADVQVYDGTVFTVVSEANADPSANFQPFGWAGQIGSALYLGFKPPKDAQPPNPGERLFPQQISLRVFMSAAAQAGKAQSAADVALPPAPPVKLVWECLVSKAPLFWRPLTTFTDETAGFTREGYIKLEGPAKAASAALGKVGEERFWLRCRLDSGAFPAGQVPEIDFLKTNTVSAKSLTTVREEVLGESDGTPVQRFQLRRKPVFKGSLVLRVEGDSEPWTQVDDFLASSPDDPHYVLNLASGEIGFGDGLKGGRIPAAAAQIVAAAYRYGGGAKSNVGANSIKMPLSTMAGVDSVTNLRPAVGGEDEQQLEDLKREAPAVLRHRNRAVTAEDFTALALKAGGVAKATAIGQANPNFPGASVPGAVTVVIVPSTKDKPPEPSGDLIRHVCNFLDGYRLLTTELYVKGPRYIEITVEVQVEAKAYVAAGTVEDAVRKALDKRLDPIVWPFGRDFYPTGLYRDILGVGDGTGQEIVVQVRYLSIKADGLPLSDTELKDGVKLEPDQLIYGGEHTITVVPDKEY